MLLFHVRRYCFSLVFHVASRNCLILLFDVIVGCCCLSLFDVVWRYILTLLLNVYFQVIRSFLTLSDFIVCCLTLAYVIVCCYFLSMLFDHIIRCCCLTLPEVIVWRYRLPSLSLFIDVAWRYYLTVLFDFIVWRNWSTLLLNVVWRCLTLFFTFLFVNVVVWRYCITNVRLLDHARCLSSRYPRFNTFTSNFFSITYPQTAAYARSYKRELNDLRSNSVTRYIASPYAATSWRATEPIREAFDTLNI